MGRKRGRKRAEEERGEGDRGMDRERPERERGDRSRRGERGEKGRREAVDKDEGGRQDKKEEVEMEGREGKRKNYSSILYIFCQNITYFHLAIIFVYYITSGSRAKRGYPLVCNKLTIFYEVKAIAHDGSRGFYGGGLNICCFPRVLIMFVIYHRLKIGIIFRVKAFKMNLYCNFNYDWTL